MNSLRIFPAGMALCAVCGFAVSTPFLRADYSAALSSFTGALSRCASIVHGQVLQKRGDKNEIHRNHARFRRESLDWAGWCQVAPRALSAARR